MARFTWLESSRKRLFLAGLIALGLHVPFTPALPVIRVLRRFAILKADPPPAAPAPVPAEVELLELARAQDAKHEQAAVREQARDKNTLSVDTPPPPAPIKFAAAAEPEPATEAERAEAEKADEKAKHTEIGLNGLAKDLLGKPGMTLGVWFSSFRDHPLGASVGDLLACDRQWSALSKQGLDPLRDLDRAVVVGPSFGDADKMTAAIGHHLPDERVRSVMGGLVEQSGAQGSWLEDRVAKVRLGKVRRVVFPQSNGTLFATPETGWQSLHGMKEPLRIPSADGRSFSLTLRQPSAAFSTLHVTVPKRLEEMRIDVYANVDQSVEVRLEFDDASEATASSDARELSHTLRDWFSDLWTAAEVAKAITGVAAGSEREPAPELDFSASEKTITGTVRFSPSQAKASMGLLSTFLCKKRPSAKR